MPKKLLHAQIETKAAIFSYTTPVAFVSRKRVERKDIQSMSRQAITAIEVN